MILSQIAFALGACGGLARILIPSAVNTASKELVNRPARSLIRNLTEAARWPRSIRTLRAACVVQESGLSARTIARRLSSVSGLYAYLVARGDTPVQVNPVPRGLLTLAVFPDADHRIHTGNPLRLAHGYLETLTSFVLQASA
jgi:Phage integrase, N-terminal SAM-like domain